MNHSQRSYPSSGRADTRDPHPQFAVVPGERWRRFLERVGTRSNDFGTRLARARFVYLHGRDAHDTHWLPL